MSEYKTNLVKVEDEYANKPIPDSLRKPWVYPAAVYLGMTAVLSAFMSGGGLVAHLSFTNTILAILLGSLLLTFVFYVPMGRIGSKEGVNTYAIGEAAFGKKGTKIATAGIITLIPCIGWYGIQVSIAVEALNSAFNLNNSLGPLLMIIVGLMFAVPAMFGLLSMAWMNYVSIPVIFFITIYGMMKALDIVGFEGVLSYQPTESYSVLWGINLLIGTLVVGASFVSDYTRWIKNKTSQVVLSGIVGLLPFTLFLTVAGSIMALSAAPLGVEETWNIAAVLTALGLPAISLVFVVLLQWTTCITASYSSGLAMTKLFGWKRFWWTLIAAGLGIVLAITGIMQHFLTFVMLLAIFVSPAVGVILSEYYLVSKKRLVRKEGFYWPGIIAWVIGGIGGYFLTFFIQAINGLIIAMIAYYVINLLINKNSRVEEEKVS